MQTPGRVFDHDGCVTGSLHQGSQMLSAKSKGLQCVPVAICSLLRSTQVPPDDWKAYDIDCILQAADNLYACIGKLGTLVPSDTPNYIVLNGVNYKLNELKSHIGSFSHANEESKFITFDMLGSVLPSYRHMLCIGDNTVSVMHMDGGRYFICDSHSRSIEGYPVPNGTAVLLSFNPFEIVYNYV